MDSNHYAFKGTLTWVILLGATDYTALTCFMRVYQFHHLCSIKTIVVMVVLTLISRSRLLILFIAFGLTYILSRTLVEPVYVNCISAGHSLYYSFFLIPASALTGYYPSKQVNL